MSIFDRDCLREGCVVRDFCTRLGIPVAGIPITHRNQTLPFELVQLLYLFHRHRLAGDRIGLTPGNFERLRARLDKIVDPKLRLSFSEAVYRRLFSNMTDDLEWARHRFGERIAAIDVPQGDSATVSSIRDLRVLSDSLFARLTTLAPREMGAAGLRNTEANAGRILQALA